MIRDAWPWATAVVLITGVVAQNAAVIALGFALALACFAAMLWARYSLSRLIYERQVPEDHAFAGERITVDLRLTNRKPLPLPRVDVRDQFPEAMVRADDPDFHPTGQYHSLGIDWTTTARGYQRVRRTIELRAPERGLYHIGPARVRSGDPFGLFSEERYDEHPTPIVVYPRTYDLPALGLPPRRPYGEQSGAARVFEDPLRIAGLRDYRPGDSLRRIDWKATARRGALQARVYEPAASRHLLLCLNTQTVVPAWAGYVPEVLERAISVAASIARDAYDRRYSAGLLATSSLPDADRAIRIPPGRRPEQFIRILEALAVVSPFVLQSLESMLDAEEHRLVAGTTIVAVTGIMTEQLASTLLRLRSRGHAVVVLSVSGDLWPEHLGVLPVTGVSTLATPFTRTDSAAATRTARAIADVWGKPPL